MKIILALFLVSVLVACSSKDNSEPPALLTKIEDPIDLNVLWSVDTRAGRNISAYQYRPFVLGNQVLTIGRNGVIRNIDPLSGLTNWRFNSELAAIVGLTGSDKTLIATSQEGDVVSFRLEEDGLSEKWRARLSGEIRSLPVIHGNQIFIRTVDGRLSVLNLIDGTELWRASGRVPSLSLTGNSRPVVSEKLVISGFDDGKLVAFDRNNGKTVWEIAVSYPDGRTDIERLVDIDAPFVLADGILYVNAYQGRLVAVQIRDGNVLWSRDMSSFNAMSHDQDALYIIDDNSHLWSIDRRTGSAFWKQDALHARKMTSPLLADKFIVAGDLRGYIHWFRKSDGEALGRIRPTENRIFAMPTTWNQIIFTMDKNGFLSATRLAYK
jgi:outer membrane protein assembly factor BamB